MVTTHRATIVFYVLTSWWKAPLLRTLPIGFLAAADGGSFTSEKRRRGNVNVAYSRREGLTMPAPIICPTL